MNIKTKLKAAALAASTLIGPAMGQAITMDTVPVGNIGNAPDNTGYGAVGYAFQIGKYEVTNTQYAAFLNAVAATDTYGLSSTSLGSSQFSGITRSGTSGSYSYATKTGFENKPVNAVSFWDATRFANWLNNGQGSGSTETGSYTLGSVTNPVNSSVSRNVGANWVVASLDEWYKAAFYDPTKDGAGGYWLSAMQSDTQGNNTDFAATNGANYNDGDFANGGYSGPGTTDVGAYSNADSYYGTFDQGGNLWEWTDTQSDGTFREQRGADWSTRDFGLRPWFRSAQLPEDRTTTTGFRVASLVPIPEPSTYGAAMGAMALGVVMLRRRKTRA